MSFETKEISSQDGNLVSHEFRWGETVWRHTSADREIEATIAGTTYAFAPVAISDNGMVQGGSANNDLTVMVQQNIPLVDLFRSTPPAGEIALTVRAEGTRRTTPMIGMSGGSAPLPTSRRAR